MKKHFPLMYDRPEKTQAMAGIAYGVICFYTLPFLALFFAGGFTDAADLSWFEVVYHIFNFGVTLWIFRDYLKESFFNVQYNLKSFLKIVSICVLLIVLYAVAGFVEFRFFGPQFGPLAAEGTLPLVEMELFNLSSNLIYVNPIGGILCVAILSPVTISCIYYASSFAPACSERPWLAYIVVIIYLAIPRALNALTFWPLEEEVILYLVQLPVHLIACYAYEKADTVWAPICTIAASNILSVALYYILF